MLRKKIEHKIYITDLLVSYNKMASWFIPSVIPPSSVWDHLTGKNSKSVEQWVGPIEALVALAYKRFRPGAKLKIDSFKITNDHSHPVNVWGEYNFDWQSVKRTILGGKGADMYNLKNPIYYCSLFLNLLPREKSHLLLELSLQSTESMIETTYATDQVAKSCLSVIQKILNTALNYSDDEDRYIKIQEDHGISKEYTNNPLTLKSIEVWKSHLNWLENICDEFAQAYEKSQQGADYEPHLSNIRVILDKISEEMSEYYEKIIKGQ